MCKKILCKSSQIHQKSARQITRRVAAISRAARQIASRVAAISLADRWLRKLVVSHENGFIQAGNDPTASHLLLTISMCKKILCKSSQIHQKICSTNNETSHRYFSSSSTNSESSRRYFSSRSMAKKTRCFS